jgi:hypothetical protein
MDSRTPINRPFSAYVVSSMMLRFLGFARQVDVGAAAKDVQGPFGSPGLNADLACGQPASDVAA